jgi:hypothetical protein
MKIIERIKNSVIKNPDLFEMYKKLAFIKNISLKDFLEPQKLLLFKRVYPYTMVGYERLSNTYELAKLVEQNRIKGAFVECGVWKGGCAAIMAYVAQKAESGRKTWLFDSFEGLPEPTDKDGKKAREYASNRMSGRLLAINRCVACLGDVKKILFEILKINPENVVISKGWFQNTLPKVKDKIGPIAILRLDGDWYESTRQCLDNLYDIVIQKGYIIIDDYGHWEGAKRAVDEFLAERRVKPDLVKIDYTGIYFQKP